MVWLQITCGARRNSAGAGGYNGKLQGVCCGDAMHRIVGANVATCAKEVKQKQWQTAACHATLLVAQRLAANPERTLEGRGISDQRHGK